MKFFIDTANLDEIKAANDLGVLDGVTTNPTLMAREGIKSKAEFETRIRDICELVDGPVSAEVISTDYDGMVAEARELAKIHENVVVKIPMLVDGIKAVKTLAEEDIPANVTLVFSALQALLAAKAGAAYVSPFVGRLDAIGHDGMAVVQEIVEIYSNYLVDTEIIVASIRHPKHVLEAAKMGADISTIPYNVIAQLAKHPLTDTGLEAFLRDYRKSQA